VAVVSGVRKQIALSTSETFDFQTSALKALVFAYSICSSFLRFFGLPSAVFSYPFACSVE
jgi:hypothetical protein